MQVEGDRRVEYRLTVSGSPRRGYAWRLWQGGVLVASGAGTHSTAKDAEADASQVRRFAGSARYEVVRAGITWSWRARYEGVIRAHGAAGFLTEGEAHAGAHEFRAHAGSLA